MDFTGKKFLNKLIAIIAILAMTLSDFVLVGASAVSYAVDIARTTVDNVEFSAYFENSNGERINKVEQATDAENLKMYVDVSVKNEGYFDGQISLGNSNFKIVNKILSDSISKIESNTVSLKRIDAGKTAKIELEIEKALPDTMPASLLNINSEVSLTGKYTDSKKTQDISGKANLEVDWKTSENIKAETSLELLTNNVYEIDSQSKRVVQLRVTSKLTNNYYPVKSTKIYIAGSQGAEGVTVEGRSTMATNGNAPFSNQNYTYNNEESKLEITISNDSSESEAGTIRYVKDSIDEFIVTYIFPIETEMEGTEFLMNAVIVPYDNYEKTAQNVVSINEEKDGIVSLNIESSEKEIYKGKIYTGEARAYESTTKINVNKVGIAENIQVNELPTAYRGATHTGANIFFTQTKIVKAEFDKIFGTDGFIKFTDNTGNNETIIKTIDSNSEVDQDGNISVVYPENVKSLKIETSKPIKVGTLNIINTKTIKEDKYDRETISSFVDITEIVRGKYNNQEENTIQNQIALKETSSKAAFSISSKELSTTEQNTVKFGVKLDTSDESRDLYKNPTIKITLPKQVKAYELTANLLHANGLQLGNNSISKEQDGENKVITINLTGEQTQYVTDTTGTTLILEAKLDLDPLAISSSEEIKLNYTNENAKTYVDGGEKKLSINVIAKNPLIVTNKINELNLQIVQEENEDIELPIESEEKKLTNVMDVVNNETNKITNVKILGRYPTNGKTNNMGITITKQAQSITQKNVKIYFSTEENATNDLSNTNNKWTEQQTEATKSYMIVIDTLEVGEKFTFGYEMNVPANLKYNLVAEAGYEVSYSNEAANTQNTTKATTINFNTGKAALLEQTVVATVGGQEIKNGDTVRSGEIIKYTVNVKNDGNEDATGVSVVGNIPDGTYYVEYNAYKEMPENPISTEVENKIEEDKTKKEVKYENQTIKAKSQKTFEYMVKVETDRSKEIVTAITTTNSKGEKKESKVTNKIETAPIEVTLLKATDLFSNTVKTGYEYNYSIIVKNTSNKEKKNIKVNVNSNELLEVLQMRYIDENDKEIEIEGNSLTIEKVAAGEEKYILVSAKIKQSTDNLKVAKISANAIDGNTKLSSNEIIENVEGIRLQVSFSSKSSSKTEGYLHKGDKVEYVLNIKNIGQTDAENLEISDLFSDYLMLESIKINNQDVEYKKETKKENGKIDTYLSIAAPLKAGESLSLVITAKADDTIEYDELTKVTNKATINNEVKLAETDEIVYLIEKTLKNSSEVPGNGNGNGNGNESGNGNGNESGNGSSQGENGQNGNGESQGGSNGNNPASSSDEKTYTISGTAWKDKNENGIRDQEEEVLADVNVKLIDVESRKYVTDSSGKEITAKTNSEGLYSIANIPQGKYIVVFEYDSAKYMPTTYKAEGVASNKNSDAILNTITINGEQKQLATTDTIELKDSIANIDIGLVDAKVFDMELEKYITKLVVTNSAGTSTYDYKDSTLAKVDIAAKNLSNSQVVVEYTIKVKNVGEIAGYVKNIVDYKSTALEFSSTLNKDWYAQGDNLYNSSLANTELQPGETKELKLILTKTMTESNTGLISNTAEIAEAYNTRGASDKDSTPGNRINQEDDMGQADLIIGIKTGAVISYILITISIIAVLAIGVYLISKKTLNKEIKFE